jgi:HEAT repeat protein
MAFDWKRFVKMWVAYVEAGVAKVAKKLAGQHVYAIVFHQGYAETNGKIDGYSVALNTTESLVDISDDEDEDDDREEIHSLRWSPEEWEFPELDAPGAANAKFYKALTKLACSSTREHWYATYNRAEAAMVDAAKELARRAKKKQGVFAKLELAPDFVVFVHDTSKEGRAKLRACLSPAQLAKHFPRTLAHEKERERIAKLPTAKRLAYYVTRLREYGPPVSSSEAEAALIAMGLPSVVPLVAGLDKDVETGTSAAMILAKIGAPKAAFAAKALAKHAREDSTRGAWSARALGSLGRVDLLEPLARAQTTRSNGIAGLVAARPSSYAVLESLLREKIGAKVIAEALKPGRNSYEPPASSFEALAAAAKSKHEIIRKDVACALDEETLGKHRPAAVALLVTMLADRSHEVQRLAALALGYTGQLGRPALTPLRSLARSKSPEVVREAASYALGKLRQSGVT